MKKLHITFFTLLSMCIIALVPGVPAQAAGPFTCSDTVRIMPTGDSLTQGYASGVNEIGDQIAYRKTLHDDLLAQGRQFDLVGSFSAGYNYAGFDADHTGVPGWNVQQIEVNIYDWLVANNPDIVLLHAGTNDVNVSFVNNYNRLLNNVDTYENTFNTDVTVVVALIINRVTSTGDPLRIARTHEFNAGLESLVNNRIASGDDLILIDMENDAGIIYDYEANGGNFYDLDAAGIHLGASGYDKMAALWESTLLSILPDCSSPTNNPPTANAGADQTVVDTDGNGSEFIFLTGAASSDSDGTITSYSWVENGVQIATGATPSHVFNVGTYTVTLTVTDNEGATGTDTVQITVQGAGNLPPNADAGTDVTVVDSDNNGTENVTLNGSNSSDSDGTIVSYEWQENGVPIGTGVNPTLPFSVGVHTITLVVLDNDSATDTDTVVINVQAGSGGGSNRVTNGLLALYEFNENGGSSVADTSGSGTPLNLTISNTGNASWGAGTLTTTGSTVIQSSGPATKIIDSVQTTNEITLEAWVQSNDLTQSGPARVAGISGNPSNRNITLGQGLWGSQPLNVYDVRLRTRSTTTNGIPSLSTPVGGATTNLAHVVYTHATNGISTLYVNGVAVANGQFGTDLGNWDTTFKMVLANEPTGDRPWLGTFHLVAVYNRALGSSEVQQNYSAGADGGSGGPTNQAPTANAGADQTITDTDNSSSELVSLDGTGSSDSDGTVVSYSWSENGTEIATGATPQVAFAVGSHTVTLTVTDDDGATDTDSVVITVNAPANVAPTANAGVDQSVVDSDGGGDEQVTLDGTGSSDSDGTIASYSWTENSIEIATGATPQVAFAVGSHTVTLTVTDDDGATATDTVDITVTAPGNQAPIANAGADQTVTDTDNNGNETVTLDGNGSTDSDGTIASYSWQISSVEIATGVNPSIVLNVGTHTITLVVTDDDGATASDDVVITVSANAANVAPTANAGPDQTITDSDNNGSEAITLNGSGSSDSDGTIASYSWMESGSQIATGATPSVSLSVGTHNITLIVTDDDGATSFDTVVVTVQAGSGGGSNRVTNGLLALYEFNENGGSSVADTSGSGTPLNLTISNTGNASWGTGTLTTTGSTVIQSGGPATKIIDSVRTTNEITLEAWVQSNDLTQSGPARVAGISGNPSNRNITLGQGLWGSQPLNVYDVRLRTRSTTTNGIPSLSTPVGGATTNLAHVVYTHATNGVSTLYVNGVAVATKQVGTDLGNWDTTFKMVLANEPTGDRPWLGTFHLVAVYNRALGSSEVQQNYSAGADGGSGGPTNQPPTANAGADQTVTDSDNSGTETVMLNGTASSDSDGTVASYVWAENGIGVATGATPSIDLAVGTHMIILTVTDDDGATDTDTVVITVNSPANQAPAANAGTDQTVTDSDNNGSEAITLNGSGSSDPESGLLRYLWSATGMSIPEGAIVSADFPVGTTEVTLTVIDPEGAQDTDTVSITVNAGGGTSVVFPGTTWATRTPAQVGLNETLVNQFISNVGGTGVIIKDGYLVASWGSGGNGDWASAVKPLWASMLFFAIEENLATGVNQPISDFGWSLTPEDQTMTISHLLNMVSGYARGEGPGQAFAYNDYGVSLYVKTLFDEIYNSDSGSASAVGNLVTSRLGSLQFQDGSLFVTSQGAPRLNMTPRDFARVGWWWLNKGNWDGTQLLPTSYFNTYMQPQVPGNLPLSTLDDTDYLGVGTIGGGSSQVNYGPGIYGFGWWYNSFVAQTGNRTWPDAPTDIIQASGHWNQEMMTLYPSLNMVVAARGNWGVWQPGNASASMNTNLSLLSQAAGGSVNQPPTASAGADQAVEDTDNSGSEMVALNGSGSSDSDGTIVSFSWTESAVEIASGNNPTVDLSVGTHNITLVVTDDDGATASDDVVITVNSPANEAPTANAGADQTVTDTDTSGSEIVALDGSGSSDSDGTIANYSWTESAVEIATGINPTVDLSVGTHNITLLVTDDDGATAFDTVVITVNGGTVNQPPTANAGTDQTVEDTDNSGTQAVTLNGSASTDPENGLLRYIWSATGLTIPEGAVVSAEFPVAMTEVTLTVIDPEGAQDTDTVSITVNAGPGNQPPVANAGADQTVTDSDNNGNEAVTLNGSGSSDSDGSIVSYSWNEGGSQIATGVSPAINLSVGTHNITLIVTDDDGATAFDMVVITVQAGSSGGSRVTNSLLALYAFNETSGNTVADTSGAGTPMNLTISNTGNVTQGGGALTVNSSTVIQSSGAATKLIDGIKLTNEVTLEAWIQSNDLTQSGPARVAGISGNPSNRNITLGQGLWGSQPLNLYDMRLRTRSTNPNGTPSLSSPAGTATTNLMHVVLTHEANGTSRIYINGVAVANHNQGSDMGNWDTSFPFVLANEPTGDRPWLGTFYLVAVYNRALSSTEVQQNYNAGANGS